MILKLLVAAYLYAQHKADPYRQPTRAERAAVWADQTVGKVDTRLPDWREKTEQWRAAYKDYLETRPY